MLEEAAAHTKPKSLSQDFSLDPGEEAYFSIDGMWCAGCAVAAENILRNQTGVKSVDVSFAAERGKIRYDPNTVKPEMLLRRLDNIGYKAKLLSDRREQQLERQQERALLQLIVSAAFGMQVMLLYIVQLYPAYAAGNFSDPEIVRLQYLVWLLVTPVLLVGGFSFLSGAWRALKARTATMDTLVAMGTLSAYSYSAFITLRGGGEVYFDSVAMITTFIILGRYLEAVGGGRARKDIRKLLKLQPDKAWKKVNGDWEEVSVADLVVNDVILVKPGGRVPVDAEILEGQAAINEALLTGESLPVEKEGGDKVFAGTIVTDNSLICRVLHPVQDTRLAHITQLVEKTLSSKPRIQRLADRASAYFTFGILGIAVITAIGWYIYGNNSSEALLAAVAVLVVACPCALGLATPLALTVTLGHSAQAGVLVRNASALESAAHTQRIVFDKTGTLTKGEMSVAATVPVTEIIEDQNELLCLAASVEQYSEHPIARAIVKSCDVPFKDAYEFKAQRGLGASAMISGDPEQRILVGSENFVGVNRDIKFAQDAEKHTERGETVVWVGLGDIIAGFIALRDEPQPGAREMLEELESHGIKTVMLSGDSPQTTKAIAHELGLTEYEGHCPPEEKAKRIHGWQQDGERVAMVGDGVNDAPALAQADLSITTSKGTDVAGETSDVILVRQDLALVPWFLKLSERTRRIIIENLGWAFLYNIITLPLAAFGVISPVIAAITMASSSLLVVGNSLRLRK